MITIFHITLLNKIRWLSKLFPRKIFILKTTKIVPAWLSEEIDNLGIICFYKNKNISKQKQKIQDDQNTNIKPEQQIVAIKNGQVISRLKIFIRPISWHGKNIILGGISGVCTLPAYRRQGVGSKLVRKALIELAHLKIDVAFLRAETSNQPLYKKLGFKNLPQAYRYQGRSGKFYMATDGMICPISSPQKYDMLLTAKSQIFIGVGIW